MSFFGKIKQGLGIGTASIELQVPAQVEKAAGEVRGTLAITAKSDQRVKSITVKLVETHTTGRGNEQKTREYTLGEVCPGDGPFQLKAEERREIGFVLPVAMRQSAMQALADKGGALGMLGKVATAASNEKSDFHVKAVADLEGVALDPTHSRRITFC